MEKSTWTFADKYDFHTNSYEIFGTENEKMISIKRPIITFSVNTTDELLLKYATSNVNYMTCNESCVICNNHININILSELNACDKCLDLIMQCRNNLDKLKILTTECAESSQIMGKYACNCEDKYMYIKKIKDTSINKQIIDGVLIYCKNMYFLKRKNIKLCDFPYSKDILPSYYDNCMICEMMQAMYTYDGIPCCYDCVQYSIIAIIERNYIKLLMIDEITKQHLIRDLLDYISQIYYGFF